MLDMQGKSSPKLLIQSSERRKCWVSDSRWLSCEHWNEGQISTESRDKDIEAEGEMPSEEEGVVARLENAKMVVTIVDQKNTGSKTVENQNPRKRNKGIGSTGLRKG